MYVCRKYLHTVCTVYQRFNDELQPNLIQLCFSIVPFVESSAWRFLIHTGACEHTYKDVHNLVGSCYVLNEQQNRLRATHVAIIKNMKQDVSTRRSLSTSGTPCTLQLTRRSLSTSGTPCTLQLTRRSCFIFLIIAMCVARKRFCCSEIYIYIYIYA